MPIGRAAVTGRHAAKAACLLRERAVIARETKPEPKQESAAMPGDAG
jgi:hypothetical protein